MKNIENSTNQNLFSSSEEFDIRLILNFFERNKLFVGSFSILFMVIFSLYSLTLKKIWEGQFQIVLKTESTNNNLNVSSSFNLF
ncbi:Wzz/FepE/Etk N-terminal domain-containing protein [Prochlorococcus sp. AH-736-E20]|nr:Wzz/FepE/Etk N-terminal domain-containing protein [Prochlorococcus sp. AH-736-E20]